MNGVSVCLEEIALEGLDGITIPTLWRRIDSATIALCSTVDENYKEFLWRCISSCQDIEVYLLEKPRAEIKDLGNDLEVYPYHCVNEAGIRGSCATYKTRSLLDVSNISLHTAVERYGNRLVLVASQLLRNKVLLGPEFDISIKIPESNYCLLEMIGRARKLGRLHSSLGLQAMLDSRSLFAQVKTLLQLKLITKQSVTTPAKRNCSTSIIYLTRYHTEHSYDSTQFKISQALSQAPGCCMSLESLCLQLEKEKVVVEEIVEQLSKTGHVQYLNKNKLDAAEKCSNIISDAERSRKSNNTQELLESGGDKMIKFVHHFYDMLLEDENEYEDEEWMQPEKQELSINIPAEVPVMHAIYDFVASKGSDGASLTQCCQELSFPFFSMRKILKNMECLQVLFCKFKDVGNTKMNMYYVKGQQPHSSEFSTLHTSHSRATEISHCDEEHSSANTQYSTNLSPQAQTNQISRTPTSPMNHSPSCHDVNPQEFQIISPSRSFVAKTPAQLPKDQTTPVFTPPPSKIAYLPTTPTQHSLAGTTQPPPSQSASISTAQITNPLTSEPGMIKESHSTFVLATKEGHTILHNKKTTNQEVKDTTTEIKQSVRSRSQKNIDSERFIRRKETVLNVLKNLKVVEGKVRLTKAIRMEEKKMGLKITADRRSVSCLLDRLEEDGQLKKVKMTVKVEDEEHKVDIFCHVDIKEDDEKIAFCVQKFKDQVIIQKAKRSGILGEDKSTPVSGFLPKMPRVEILHTFLFYVVYEMNNPNVDLEAMRQKYDWAEHLKPEHVPKNIGEGWFTPFSILRLLPVSLYFKLVDTSFHNFVIKQYFDNLATRHMLLKDLPPLARQILFDSRRSSFLFESFELLALFGLITPTNKQIFFHEREIACYLHTSAVVNDTRESEPSYDEIKHPEGGVFPQKKFSFAQVTDVEQYWDTVRKICLTTPLNRGKSKRDKKSRTSTSFESLVIDDTEVPTCGKPRGDGLGAAGFHSCLYTHLRKKWRWPLLEKRVAGLDSDVEDTLDWQVCFTNDRLLSEDIVTSVGKNTKRKRSNPAENEGVKKKKKVIDEKKTDVSEHRIGCSSPRRNSCTGQPNVSEIVAKNVDEGKKKRKRRKRKKKKLDTSKAKSGKPKSHSHWSRSIHDKRDEEALKQLQAKRNTFTPQQQKLLFICCLALRIIGKKSVDTGYNDWLWTRDILYKDNYESAKTKTALSICRKYRSMISNAQTKKNMDICVADCMQEKIFQPYCNIEKTCNEAMFNELVELLKKKYSMENMAGNRLVLPSTKQEFQQQKDLYNSLKVENSEKCDEDILSLEPRESSVADIRQRIIRDSIVSALLLKDVSYQSHVAFRFLSQFTEEELIIAISVLRNGRIVVRKQLRYAKSGLDLASCAFSQMLSNHGQRIIDNHFPSSLLDDAKSFYDEIASVSKSLEHVECSERFLPLKLSESSLHGGKVYCIFALLTCQKLAVNMEIPDIFLALAKRENSKRSRPIAEHVNEESCTEISNVAIHEALSPTRTTIHDDAFESSRNDEDQMKETCESLKPESAGDKEIYFSKHTIPSQTTTGPGIRTLESKNITRMTDLEQRQSMSRTTEVNDEDAFSDEERILVRGNVNRKRSNDMVMDVLCGIEDHLFGCFGVESGTSLYKIKFKSTPTFTCLMTTSGIESVRSSGSKHLVLRNVEMSSLRDNNVYESYLEKIATYQRTGDSNRILFSINPCNIQVRLLPCSREVIAAPKEESLAQSIAHHFKSNGLKMPESIEECAAVCSRMFCYSSKDCEALKVVYETINYSKEIGISCSKVSKIVRSQHSIVSFSIDGLVKVLEAFNLVYQVGFAEVCYVATPFKKHWFLNVWEGDVRSSSEDSRMEKKQTTNSTKKRSVSEEERDDCCSKSGVAEQSKLPQHKANDLPKIENTTSTPGQTVSRRTQSRTVSSSKALDDQKSKQTRKSSSGIHGSSKQTSTETQTDSFSSKPCRPWITMAGEMNKNAYNTLHRSVLAYIINYPGVQKYTITKHFVNLLYPVAIEDILDKLRECECIERRICYIKRATLFSSKAASKSSYYLPKPDAMFKLMERVFL